MESGICNLESQHTVPNMRARRRESTDVESKKGFALTKPVQIQVNGQPPSGLEDSFGRLIDGDHDRQPGGSAVALLGRGGATISAKAGSPAAAVPVIPPFAVDVLLEREAVRRSGARAGSHAR